jgi:hypothetical protein
MKATLQYNRAQTVSPKICKVCATITRPPKENVVHQRTDSACLAFRKDHSSYDTAGAIYLCWYSANMLQMKYSIAHNEVYGQCKN